MNGNSSISPVLRPVIDLETVLTELLAEHRKLLMQLEVHQAAMQSLDVPQMELCRINQENTRLRIVRLDDRRRAVVQQIGRINQLKGDTKIPAIAALYPQRRETLMALRVQLQQVMQQVADRSAIANRLASAVLGHLNTAMRILSAAVGGGGVYTNRGVAQMARRIGAMEAVG